MKYRFINKSFGNRLFKAFMLIVLIPVIVMSAFYYKNLSEFTETKINNSVTENLEFTSKLIDSTISSFIKITNYMSYNDDVQSILKTKEYNTYDDRFKDIQAMYKISSGVLATQSFEVPIHIIDLNRKSRFSTTEYNVPIYEDSRGNFFDIMDSNEGKELSFIHRRVDGKESKDIVMAVGNQVRDKQEGEALGYIISDVYDDYFTDVFKNTNLYEDNNIYVIDKNGYIITDKKYKNMTGFKFYEEYLSYILENNKGTMEMDIDEVTYKAHFTTSPHTAIKIIELIPKRIIYKERHLAIVTFIIFIVIILFMCITASYMLSKSISQPINELSGLMKKVESGEREVNFHIKTEDEIGQLGKSFNDMVKEINRLIKEVYEKQYLVQESEFKSLKAQVNPHFLYNTLESIHWMAKLKDYEGVTDMVVSLGKLLRYSTNKNSDIVKVKEEIEQIKNYLKIQKIRYSDKFEVVINIEEEVYDKYMLRFLLQPIVENAITHGLEQKMGKGIIEIRGIIKNENICFEILDNGVGFGNSKSKGEGIGMDNVNSRVKIHYGEAYGLIVEEKDGFTSVKILIPDIDESSNMNNRGEKFV
ncbi:cache domain-containing sensor histidine kinase [Clostridium amazonitimonense]|uniref:cache domain-containing sensor histidine kinase n=1 Tax=Clostridium amazonitimonense TaxID=1499689 RepID=UPI00068AC54A|nr:sensor histidine kinase [Clostridium amazonitimonense]